MEFRLRDNCDSSNLQILNPSKRRIEVQTTKSLSTKAMQKLAEICVRRPVFATMLILSLSVVGLFSYKSLGVDLFPKIDLPTITVTIVNPGASPQEIETEITDRVEGTVNTISGIDELRSTSVEGVSQVFITFLLEKNADVAAQEVRNKVDLIVNDLPVTAEKPIVQKLDTDATPVLRIAVSAPRSLKEVTDVADKQIKQRIESINGVGDVQIIGGRTREIEIWVDPDKMRAFNVPVAEISNAVRLQNLEVPGGRIDEGTREQTVRTMGRIVEPKNFNDLIVANRGTYSVKLSDVGYAEDGFEEPRTEARLNGQPAVTLVVSKQSGQNTVAVADAVKQRLAEVEKTLPPGFRTEVVGDQTIFIKASIDAIQTHLIEGSILAAIVVFLFLVERPLYIYRRNCDSYFADRNLRVDECDGIHAESNHDAGPDAHGRNSDRRCDRGAGEHLSFYRRERCPAIPSRDRWH